METLNSLGAVLKKNGHEEAKEDWERCLVGQTKVLGEDHKDTLGTFNNLGIIYFSLENYEKALEHYERAC